MLRAMDSAVAGLRAHQNKLDVISNNIANVNTQGFKAQNYTFKDTMYQTSNASSADKNGQAGGINTSQYGYGSVMGTISTDMTVGTPSYVGGFNAAIDGTGFFITSSTAPANTIDGANSAAMKEAGLLYTRVGQFSLDSAGYVVDSNGNYVLGSKNAADNTQGNNQNQETTIGALGAIQYADYANNPLQSVQVDNAGVIKGTTMDGKSVTLGTVGLAMVQNPQGLAKGGNNTFTTDPSDNAGTVFAYVPGGDRPSLMSGYVESSNVDMAKEFSDMITAQRGFQANSKIITVSDEVLQELVNMKR